MLPEHQMENMQTLDAMGVQEMVVFDLSTANGSRPRRFYAIPCGGQAFADVPFQHIHGDPTIREKGAKILSEPMNNMGLSLLSSALRFVVRRGEVV